MAEFIPTAHIGHIYFDGEDYFKVDGFSGKLNDKVNVIYVDKNGVETGEPPRNLSITAWNKMGLKDMSTSKGDKGSNDELKDNGFIFSYDPENGDIVITHPDGIKTDRIKGLKGKDGESVFAEWCRRKGIQKPTQQDWEDFLDSLKGEPGKVVNGKDGLSAYEEWKGRQPKGATEEKLSYTAFIRSIAGEKGKDGYEGKDGKDGLSAFEVWKSIQPNGDKLTEKDFFDFLKGESGKNGHEGVDGKNGDTWKPYVSDEGILYFENTRTGERTEPVNIRGLQGPGADKGASGDTWEPYFPDDGKHQLYFKNQKGEILGPFDVVGATGKTGPQGPRGESAYQIWLNEGHTGDFHDFLLWIAEQAQKGEDGKDGDTFRPHVEKGGHLFFISTKTGERIDGGWVKGDKGDQGETGLNGHNVTHKYGYKEIYDWTCPVQEINPHLLASSDDLASGGSAEKHMRETLNRINNLRKEGKELTSEGPFEQTWANKILYFLKNPLKEFFWWCSGADRPLLRMCPAEHSKYMGIGTVIFFTALMAMVSSLFAISYVFGNHELTSNHEKFTVCVIFAIFWGLMIFFLDRFITNTMYSDGKVTISWLELRSALPRILISIFLGIVISAPLELKIFNQEINEFILSQAKTEREKNAKDSTNIDLSVYYVAVDNSKSEYDIAQKAYKRRLEQNDSSKLLEFGTQKRVLASSDNSMVSTTQDAKGNIHRQRGTKNEYTTERVFDQAAQNRYDQVLEQTRADASKADSVYLSKVSELELAQKDYINKMQPDSTILSDAGLYQRLAALHAIAFHEDRENDEGAYKSWSETYPSSDTNRFIGFSVAIFLVLIIVSLPFTKNVTKGSNKETKSSNHTPTIQEKRLLFWKGAAVLWPWFAVTALICGYCNNALFNALPYYIFSSVGMIMMLFILIDVSPVFYKMMLADGQYEQYLHKEKSITQDLVRLNFAKSIAKVNESEIGRLAPLIFSKPFDKIKEILQGSKQKNSLEWMKDENGDDIRIASQTIRESNEEVFTTVLGMKKAIIEASYQAWYRDMRDAIIGMHKPGDPNGGNASINDEPNDPDDPSARARRETGHHTLEDEPFDDENYYGRTTGTSPEYDASSDDPHPGTPEDFLNEEDSHLNNPADDTISDSADDNESDEDSSDNDSMNNSSNSDDETVEDDASESSDNNENVHPDADVESEVSDDDDDDDTINPK